MPTISHSQKKQRVQGKTRRKGKGRTANSTESVSKASTYPTQTTLCKLLQTKLAPKGDQLPLRVIGQTEVGEGREKVAGLAYNTKGKESTRAQESKQRTPNKTIMLSDISILRIKICLFLFFFPFIVTSAAAM